MWGVGVEGPAASAAVISARAVALDAHHGSSHARSPGDAAQPAAAARHGGTITVDT